MKREAEAEELISYFNEELDELTEMTSQINESERVKVIIVSTGYKWTGGITHLITRPGSIERAGGINPAVNGGGTTIDVSKEQVMEWNPDIIIISTSSRKHRLSIEEVLSDPDIQTINAVKNDRAYYKQGAMIYSDRAIAVCHAYYFAKLFYPDEFAELNVEEKGNEIMRSVYGVDGLFTEMTEKLDLYRWE